MWGLGFRVVFCCSGLGLRITPSGPQPVTRVWLARNEEVDPHGNPFRVYRVEGAMDPYSSPYI